MIIGLHVFSILCAVWVFMLADATDGIAKNLGLIVVLILFATINRAIGYFQKEDGR